MQTVMQNMKQGDPCEDAMRLVALRICELCFVNGLTCAELAARSGMPYGSVRDIINGKNSDIRFSSLVKLMTGLNTDLAYFFDSDIFRGKI